MRYTRPTLLDSHHVIENFDCESQVMNDWLKKRSIRNHSSNYSRTYVVCEAPNTVVAYCSLCTGQVHRQSAIKKLQRNAPDFIPVIVLARLATDKRHKGKGLATGLLKHTFNITLNCSSIIGVAALLVHALDDEAAIFYQSRGFKPSPIDEKTLMSYHQTPGVRRSLNMADKCDQFRPPATFQNCLKN